MTMWWQYVLFILGYIVLGVMTAVVHNKAERCDKEESIACGVLWPLVWVFFGGAILGWLLFGWWSELLSDWWDKQELKRRNR